LRRRSELSSTRTQKRFQREEISKIFSSAIRDGTLDFMESNREKRRDFYRKVIKDFSRGKEILLEFLQHLKKSEFISAIATERPLEELEKTKAEMENDIKFVRNYSEYKAAVFSKMKFY